MRLTDGRAVAAKIVSKRALFRATNVTPEMAERHGQYLLSETLTLKRIEHVRVAPRARRRHGRGSRALQEGDTGVAHTARRGADFRRSGHRLVCVHLLRAVRFGSDGRA